MSATVVDEADRKREEYNAHMRAYRASHPEIIRAINRRGYQKNIEKRREYEAARHDARQAEYRAYDAAHREERREKMRLRRATSEAKRVYREWREQGCAVCDVSDWTCVQAHHIDTSDKVDNPSAILRAAAMRIELEKCVPLCRSHHAVANMAMRLGRCEPNLGALITYLGEHR